MLSLGLCGTWTVRRVSHSSSSVVNLSILPVFHPLRVVALNRSPRRPCPNGGGGLSAHPCTPSPQQITANQTSSWRPWAETHLQGRSLIKVLLWIIWVLAAWEATAASEMKVVFSSLIYCFFYSRLTSDWLLHVRLKLTSLLLLAAEVGTFLALTVSFTASLWLKLGETSRWEHRSWSSGPPFDVSGGGGYRCWIRLSSRAFVAAVRRGQISPFAFVCYLYICSWK